LLSVLALPNREIAAPFTPEEASGDAREDREERLNLIDRKVPRFVLECGQTNGPGKITLRYSRKIL